MISVVIPLYNKEQSIESTLDSVLAQTYKDFEIVVVDDGSTDKSADVVSAIDDDRIVFISQENQGVSAARNTGIIAAKGEYVAFLDGDDLWHPEYLETLVRLISDYPNATLYGIGFSKINDNKIPINVQPTSMRGEIETPWENYVGYWTGSSSSSRELLLKAGMFDTRMTHGEDIDMWWRLLLIGKGAYDNRVLAYYRQNAENRAMNRLIPLEKHIPYYIDKYSKAREENISFRRYFDREMIYRLYPYLFDKKYKKTAILLAKKLDYSLQKWTMKFRMICPSLYRFYERIKP
jgi:glycosyltransferase involved in cell wall biosynthesis